MSATRAFVLAAGLFVATAVAAQSVQSQGPVSVMGRPAPAEVGVKKMAERLHSDSVPEVQRREIRLTAQSPEEVGAAMRQPEGGPQKIGFHRDLGGGGLDLRSELTWHAVENGQVGLLRVTSPGAMAVRLALEVEDLPEEAEFRFFGQNASEIQAITGAQILSIVDQNLSAGETGKAAVIFWSPVVEGEWIGLEVFLSDSSEQENLRAVASTLSHLVRSPLTGAADINMAKIGESGTCNNDVTCYPSWSLVSNAVAKMTFERDGFSRQCSGTLLNDGPGSGTPYFLSANHCISTQTVASTLVTHWFYRASSCGSSSLNLGYRQTYGGAALLYTAGATDTTLLRLNSTPPSGVMFSGWDTNSPILSTSVSGIHHPEGDLQKISFGAVGGYFNCTSPAAGSFTCSGSTITAGNYINVPFSSGTAEQGSSGSGIFREGGYLIGTLLGGTSTCSNLSGTNYYGRFDKAYEQGNLGQWLNPTSFTLSVSKSGSGSGTVTSSPAGINCGSTCSAGFPPASSVTLTATAASGSMFAGWSGACTGTANTCTVGMTASRSVTATFNAAAGLTNGQVISNLSGAAGSYQYLYIDVPAGATNLVLTTSGGTGDQDLYLRFSGLPTLSTYDCRIFTLGNNGTCSISAPSAGRYQILVYGYTSYSGVSLQASYSSNATYLENPFPGAKVSGIGLVSGWTCSSGVVEVSFDNGPRDNLVPKGSSRGDLLAICGRTDVGFGLLFNYNLLGPGNHTLQLFVNGQQVGTSVPFTVTVPAGEFIRGASRTVEVQDFPSPGKTTILEWQESTQNFAITGVR